MTHLVQLVKNPPANAGDTRDVGSFSGWGRSSGEGNSTPLQYSCWRIPWTEEPGRLLVHGGRKESDMTEYTYTHNCNYLKLMRKAPGLAHCLSESRESWPQWSYSQDDGGRNRYYSHKSHWLSVQAYNQMARNLSSPVQDGENTTQTTVRMLQAKAHRHRTQSLAQRTVRPSKCHSRIPRDTESCSQPQKWKCIFQNTACRWPHI